MTINAIAENSFGKQEDKGLLLQTQKLRSERFFDKLLNAHMSQVKPVETEDKKDIVSDNVRKIYDLYTGELKIMTIKNPDSSITTKEYCRVPFPYVQCETTQFEDGSKIITNFFPTGNRPAKRKELSADGKTTTTTVYDSNGNERNIIKVIFSEDGSGVEVNTEPRFGRTNLRIFDKDGVTRKIESYVGEKIAFKLDCDAEGDLQHESNFYTFLPEEDTKLQKEIIYNKDGSYLQKEYNTSGKVYFSETIKPAKRGVFFR